MAIRRRLFILLLSACTLLFVTSLRSDLHQPHRAAGGGLPSLDKKISSAKVAEEFGEIPLVFEANVGQAASDVHFLTRAAGNTIVLKDREALLLLPGKVAEPKGDRSRPD